MAEYERTGPATVRVTTRDGHLCPWDGGICHRDGSWEVPRHQWEQYEALVRAVDHAGSAILAGCPVA